MNILIVSTIDYSNSIYYTLSTIAQVLGAFISLSGVFVLFKLQELKKMIFVQVDYIIKHLSQVYGNYDVIECPIMAKNLKLLSEYNVTKHILEEVDKILADKPKDGKFSDIYDIISDKREIISNFLILIDLIRIRTLLALYFGILTIIYSFVTLGLTNSNNATLSYRTITLTFGILLAMTTMYFMVYTLVLSIKDYHSAKKMPKETLRNFLKSNFGIFSLNQNTPKI